MKRIISIFILLVISACSESTKKFSLSEMQNYQTLAQVIALEPIDDSSFPLYQYAKAPTFIFDIYFKDMPITYGQYTFNKKTETLCNVQYFIPQENNRNLLISRINNSKIFKYLDTGDTFMFTRRMQWEGNGIYLILTSVINSNKSILSIENLSPNCDY